MLVGGIENYIYKVVKANYEAGNKIIWIADTSFMIAPIYDKLFNADCMEIVYSNIHGLNWGALPKMNLSEHDDVVILSFGFFEHARALEYKKKNTHLMVRAFFLMPHFTGPLVFPEQGFNNNSFIRRKIGKIYQRWVYSNQVIFFGKRHYEVLSSNYEIDVPEENKNMVYRFDTREPFSEIEVRSRYNRNEFRIVGAGRFDFPHKGFFIGLIKTYGEFKAKYNNLTLYLIGEPIGEIDSMRMMRDVVDSFPAEIKEDIHFLKNMPESDLIDFYKTCNLMVGVAGCASMSAKNGVLTLPARHYDYSCEVYGFCPESKDRTLDSAPGLPLSIYLKRALKMTEDEYVKQCKLSYNAYEFPEIDRNYYFNNKAIIVSNELSTIDLYFLKTLFFFSKVFFKLKLLRLKYLHA